MEPSDFEAIFAALERAGSRYFVVLHGVPRFTADLDLVIALDAANVNVTVAALAGLGYRPRAPVRGEDLADPALRRSWIEDKNLVVLSFWSPDHPATEIDIFVEEPIAFEAAFARAVEADLGTTKARVAAIADLIVLKTLAGRAKDLADIDALNALESDDEA